MNDLSRMENGLVINLSHQDQISNHSSKFRQNTKMDDLTIHGFGKIFTQKKIAGRVTWAVIFFTLCALLFFLLFNSVKRFYRRDFVTKIITNRASELDLPALTICDTDMSNTPLVNNFLHKCLNNQTLDTRDEHRLFDHGCKLFLAGMKYACIFDSSHLCSFPNDFTPAKNPYYCYSINKNGLLRQKSPGRSYGLEMLMFKNLSEFKGSDYFGLHPLRRTLYARGLTLQVHSPSVSVGHSSHGIIPLIPGFYTEVAFQKKFYERLAAPYPTNCSSFSSIKNIFGGDYNVENCLTACFLLALYRKCGTASEKARYFMPANEYPTLKNQSQNSLSCMNSVYMNASALACDCPQPCYEVKYDTKVTVTPLSGSAFTPMLIKELARILNISSLGADNDESYRPHIARLSVFYDSFDTETYIEQALYGAESLFSDFGGLMGLLLGASFISLLELVWLLVASLVNKRQKNTVQELN